MKIASKSLDFSWISMLFLVLTAGSMIFVFFRKEMLYFAFFLFSTLFFIKNLYKRELIIFLKLTILFLSFLIINFLFASTSQSLQKLFANIVIFTTSIFSAMYYYRNENKKLFIDHLYFVLKLILIHSLISFFIYPLIKPFIFEISNSRYDCYTFLNLFFYLKNTHSLSVVGIDFVRNQGIFWEPGVLQIFLNLLLFIIAFIKKKKGLLFWITVLAILTTFSTTGLVVMFIQLLLSFGSEVKKNIFFLPFTILSIFLLYNITKKNISDKLHGSGQYSFQARLFDLVQPFYMVSQNPMTGVGLDDEKFIKIRQNPSFSLSLKTIDFTNVKEKGSTNSIMFFLAAAGIPFTLLILLMLYFQNFIIEKRKWFFIFIFISLMTEPIMLRPFFLTFVMSGGIYLFNKFRWKIY
ncbi:MAG: hypothetical protein CMP70_01140 [Flavobacteriales bacterium]|nr:hypothetical protein [Flavobacteriales bacterium]|tara:strand:- start:3505 stop:4728 length:1224 start_codon:yes stop_codon:yes gene_type:complete